MSRHLADDVTLQLHRHEHDLARRRLRHHLEGLQLTDLHCSGTGEDIGGLPHQTGGVDFGTSGDDLALSNTLLLGGGRQGGGNIGGEDDILDENALDRHSPLIGYVTNDFGDFERDGFAFRHDRLDGTGANNMSQGCLRTFDESLAEIRDAEGGAVRAGDLEVDDGVTVFVTLAQIFAKK